MFSLVRRGWDALAHPVVRLPAEFPLSGKQLGKAYVIAVVYFFVFSFLPVILFTVFMELVIRLLEPQTALRIITVFWNENGPKESMMMGLMLASFVTGFAAELWYLSRVLKRRGFKLRNVVGLTAAPLKGRTKLGTLWAIVWRAGLAFTAWHVFETIVSVFINAPEQPTVQFAKQLSGHNQFVWFFMAAVLAPVFEELVFRGFLFQALRSTFQGWRKDALEGQDGGKATSRLARWMGLKIFNTAQRADIAAVAASAALFSLEHMQFQLVTMALLFLMGCLLAEAFRRTGSLWVSILLHALNNGLATLMLFWH